MRIHDIYYKNLRISLLICGVFVITNIYSQAPAPSGFPAPYSTGYYRIGWLQSDSGSIPAYRDTNWIPKFQGTFILWQHSGVDTALWYRLGSKWVKILKQGDVPNLTATLPIIYNNGNISCPTCGTSSGRDSLFGVLDNVAGQNRIVDFGSTNNFNILHLFNLSFQGDSSISSTGLSVFNMHKVDNSTQLYTASRVSPGPQAGFRSSWNNGVPFGQLYGSNGVNTGGELHDSYWRAYQDSLVERLYNGNPYYIRGLNSTSDSTNYKPLAINITTGEKRQMTYWPGSGGSSGINSLNGLTGSSQTFATGTSGSDFNIVSSGTTHTFNIPTANVSNRGALSSSDWSTFNSKQSALNGTGYLKFSGTTPSYLTPAQVTADLNLFTTSLQGLVPGSGGGTSNFLRADGTWAAPPGGFADPLTTNGDIIARISGVTTRLPQGANSTFLGVSGGVLGYYTPPGITSLNGLTGATQTFATGTTGTDFGISSSGSIHTFNLPVASATNTGKLSNTDWTTFNNKLTSASTQFSVTGNGTGGSPIQLVNDVSTPGYNQRYGSRWDGTKGYSWEGTDYVNILDFGADSTGTTNIATALTNALSVGKPVYIPSGNWKLTSHIQLTDGAIIIGAWKKTRILLSGTGYSAIQLAHRCVIANLSFVGTLNAGGDSSQVAIRIDSTNGSTIINNQFDSVGKCVQITRNGLEANLNIFSQGNIVSENIMARCSMGVDLNYRAEYNIVSDNIINFCSWGINQVGGNNLIRNNNCNSGNYGIYVAGQDNPSNNNAHNAIIGNAMNHNTYSIWLDSVTLGCRVLGNLMYFGETHLRKCSNVTFESNDISGGVLAGEANTTCFFNRNRIRLTTYNLMINNVADNIYFVDDYYEGSTFYPYDVRTVAPGGTSLAIKTQLDTTFVFPFHSLQIQADATTIPSQNQQLLTVFNNVLGISDSYIKFGSGTTSTSDWLPWFQTLTHAGTAWGLLMTTKVGSDANSAYYSAGLAINVTTAASGSVSTIPLFRVDNNTATSFTVGPLGNTAIGANYSSTTWLSLPAGSSTVSEMQFTAATPRSTLVAGQINFNTGLLMLDSSASVRDTLSTRSWVRNNFSSGGGTPAGSNTQIQFNNSGTFGASASLTFASSTLTAANMAISTLTNAGANDSVLMWNPSTNKVEMKSAVLNLFAANGATFAGGDSIYAFSGVLNQTSTVQGGGFSLTMGTTGSKISTLTFNTTSGSVFQNGGVDIGGTSVTSGRLFTLEGNTNLAATSSHPGFLLNTQPGTNNDGTTSGTSSFGIYMASFNQATLTATSAATYPEAVTLYVNGAPIASTNVTITNNYAFKVGAGNSYFNGNINSSANTSISFSHFMSNSGTPGIAAGSGAGGSPTVSITGNDAAGDVTVTTGTLPSASATVATITYVLSFPTHSYPILMPANSNAALLSGVTSVFTTGNTTTFVITSGTTGLTAATTYVWHYQVFGD